MKKGRKSKDGENRNVMISLRLTERELEWIDEKVSENNSWEDKPLSRTDWILKTLRNNL